MILQINWCSHPGTEFNQYFAWLVRLNLEKVHKSTWNLKLVKTLVIFQQQQSSLSELLKTPKPLSFPNTDDFLPFTEEQLPTGVTMLS